MIRLVQLLTSALFLIAGLSSPNAGGSTLAAERVSPDSMQPVAAAAVLESSFSSLSTVPPSLSTVPPSLSTVSPSLSTVSPSLSTVSQDVKDVTAKLKSVGSSTVEFVIEGRSGVADIQYPCYRVFMSDMQIYGDGHTMWLYYTDDMEVAITNSILESLVGASSMGTDAKGHLTFTVAGNDGKDAVLTVTGIEPNPSRWSADHFTLDVSKLPKDVIVTDLR